MSLTDALEALKVRLESIDGLTVTTDPAAEVVVPMAIVDIVEMDYNEAFERGGSLLAFQVIVYVSGADNPEGLYEARSYLSAYGDRSVRVAIETAPDAGDGVSYVVVDTGRREVSDNFITARFDCRSQLPGPS